MFSSNEFRIIVTYQLWKKRNRISTEEYFRSSDTLDVKYAARCGRNGGSLVTTVEKDLRRVTGLSYSDSF